MSWLKVDNAQIYFELHGETGPAMVLAHGGGGNHLSWWQQVPRLSRHFRCLVFDHRGFGLSREEPGGTGPRAFTDDLRRLLDHLEIERAILVGQSMGGWTALGFASTYPERSAALVLCDSTGGVDEPAVIESQHELRKLAAGGLNRVVTQAFASDFSRRAPAMAFLYAGIGTLNQAVPSDLLNVLLELRHPAQPVVAAGIPVMVMAGEQDSIMPPRVLKLVAECFPGARYTLVEGAGHSIYFERPEAFNRELLRFLRASARG